MAADDAAVVVRLSANLKDYEAALKNAVRSTERAAAAAEKAMSGVGKGGGASNVIQANFQKSSAAIVNDAKVMQYQLNDIFSGLASGQGIRAVQQQLGQIAQQMSGGGLAAGARTLGTAMLGMINPINAAVVAFGLLATAAASYFGEDDDAKDMAKTLEKQRDLIRDVAKQWGDALPAVKDYNDELERLEGIQKQLAGLQATAADAAAKTQEAFDKIDMSAVKDAFSAFAGFKKYKDDVTEWKTQWEELQKALKAGTVTQAQYTTFADKTNELMRTLPIGSLKELTKHWLAAQDAISGYVKAIVDANSETKKLVDSNAAVVNAINRMAPPLGTLSPVTSGAGMFNPSQTQLDNAKKAQEKAEADAKEAARKAEQAAEANKRKAEQAAKEAADRLNEAIANQTKIAVDAVTGMLGKSETANAGEINAFLKRGGVDVDAATTAWCAAFVNSALAQVGIKGTGSNVATSFAGWGQAVKQQDIQRGDVLVENRGRSAGETGGHVGFATGQMRATADGIQQIEMISGNSANKVQQQWIDATDVIARRSTAAFQLPADALKHLSDEASAASAAAKKASDEQLRAAQNLAMAYNNVAQNAVGGLVSDLMHGATAAEALNDMLSNVLESLAQMAIQQLFNPAGSKGGGLLGALFGLPIGHGGGNVSALAAGRQRNVSPLAFAGAPRFASGGVVGMSPGEVPIIAHRGEVIVPNARRLAGSGKQPVQNVSTSLGDIHMDMSQTGLVAADNDSAKQFGINVQKIVQREMVRESRPGGLLRERK